MRLAYRAREVASLLPSAANVDCLMEIVDLADHRLIRLVGRLTAAQVHELLEASRASHQLVRLDLSELMSVDAIGLQTLHDIRRHGAELLDAPAYIQLKLESLSAKESKRRD